MKKPFKILFISLFIISLFFSNSVEAATSSDFTNHQAPTAIFYPQEFDKLIMDLTIPSGLDGEDKLLAIVLQNEGSARDFYEFNKIKLWSDVGPAGFQGMEIDKELGTFSFYNGNTSWYLDTLAEFVPVAGLRIFISCEIGNNPTAYRSVQMKIPVFSDENENGAFDQGDLGIFMESGNNGPTDETIINSYIQTIRDINVDSFPPKSQVIDPDDNAEISTESYTISGVARDSGGSTPAWVKIGINDVWRDVIATDSNYTTWEYEWTNITEGTYILETKSADWIGNTETPANPVTVTVDFPEECICEDWIDDVCGGGTCEETKMYQTRICDPSGCDIEEQCVSDSSCEEEEEKTPSEMTIEELKAKIAEIQQQIIALLTQLIQLLQAQIASL